MYVNYISPKKSRPDPKPQLMDQVRQALGCHHYAYRTEQTLLRLDHVAKKGALVRLPIGFLLYLFSVASNQEMNVD